MMGEPPTEVLVIGIPLFLALIAYVLIRSIKNIKKYKEGIINAEFPEKTRNKILRKFKKYESKNLNIQEMVKIAGAYFRKSVSSISTTHSVKKSFKIFPLVTLKNILEKNPSLTKIYSMFFIKKLIALTPSELLGYNIIKIKEGYLESFFDGSLLTIKINNQVIAYLDYKTKEILTPEKKKIGKIESGLDVNKIQIKSLGSFKMGFETNIFIHGKKIAKINPFPSTIKKIEKHLNSISTGESLDIPLFEDLNISSDWESYLLFAIGIFEYSLLNVSFNSGNNSIQNRSYNGNF